MEGAVVTSKNSVHRRSGKGDGKPLNARKGLFGWGFPRKLMLLKNKTEETEWHSLRKGIDFSSFYKVTSGSVSGPGLFCAL